MLSKGQIGFSTAAWFSMAGVECIGTDIDEAKVEAINRGIIPMEGVEPVLPKGLCNFDLITATTDWWTLINDEEIEAFFIAIPTEKNGESWWEPLKDVVGKLSLRKDDPLIIIESTVAVGTVNKLILPFLKNVAVCPRRDWFTMAGKNLKTLPRIVGGVDKEVTSRAIEVLSIVCDELIPATYQEAELVKAYENAYRHLTCVLAQEMALAYNNIDIRRVLELGGTKWNIEEMYFNAFGTGGYCLPLAPRYVLEGASHPEALTLIKEAIKIDDSMVELFSFLKGNKTGCLGLAYMGNIKVHVLSPLIRLLRVLDRENIKVNDPLYSREEIERVVGCEVFDFPADLDEFDVVLLLCDHDAYKEVEEATLIEKTQNCRFVFDNTGLWKDIPFKCPYYLSGQKGWQNFTFC